MSKAFRRAMALIGPASAGPLAVTQGLALGGDGRIAIEPGSGRNGYGCVASPDPDLVRFGSSTASTIGKTGYRAATMLCERLGLRTDGAVQLDEAAMAAARIRQDLIDLCGIRHRGGVQAILAASGTDAHLIFAQLVLHLPGPGWLAIMPDASETGSGVPMAIAGRHFASESALGATTTKGAALSDRAPAAMLHYAVRNPDGSARSLGAIDDEIDAAIGRAVAAGQRVLLVAVDGSKTGIVAPSPARVVGWKSALGDMIEVLVDACQFRLPTARLEYYLAGGCTVAVTGSKFIGGPIFSGALLVPGGVAARLRGVAPPAALADYTARHDWPAQWRAVEKLDTPVNVGLLLRWQAALAEMQRFRAVPETAVQAIVADFHTRFTAMMQRCATIAPIRDDLPDLTPGSAATIFPFHLMIGDSGTPRRANPDEARRAYRQMREPDIRPTIPRLRFELGQPVALGRNDAVLRLSLSAPLIADAHHRGPDYLTNLAASALARLADLMSAA
ncbi:hypothetical protein U1839_14360 [Sphingomonas sp. RT2P30]